MHKRILITGANGFVAGHLIHAIHLRGGSVIGMDLSETPNCSLDAYHACDLLDPAAVKSVIGKERPDAIIHLAAVSSVAMSWEAPSRCFLNNTQAFLSVADAVRSLNLKARILSVGSSEEYGLINPSALPVAETHPTAPSNPYAVARVAQEQLSRLYARNYGMDVVMTRSFNQIGPGQRANFVIASFVRQLLDGKSRGESVVKLQVGDLSIVRDFLDVRDAADGYLRLLEQGISGEVYNLCSGIGRKLGDVLNTAARLANVTAEPVTDPARLRPADNPIIIGNNAKLRQLGWSPTRTIEATLSDMLKA